MFLSRFNVVSLGYTLMIRMEHAANSQSCSKCVSSKDNSSLIYSRPFARYVCPLCARSGRFTVRLISAALQFCVEFL